MTSILDFQTKKKQGKKISMITCYDYTSARIADQTAVDALLVGDSLAMTILGHNSTVPATLEAMALFTAAVSRGAPKKFIVGDMPFLSYRRALEDNITAVQAIMRAGAHAIKMEGLSGNADLIRHLVQSGVPVMGHIGLTPQFVNQMGGYHVQGKTSEDAARLMQEARALQDAGCFSIVLECVPAKLADDMTRTLDIPTIGIGAGAGTDGQVLVWQDMLGLNTEFKPKFVRAFMDGAALTAAAINDYVSAVEKGEFPGHENSY